MNEIPSPPGSVEIAFVFTKMVNEKPCLQLLQMPSGSADVPVVPPPDNKAEVASLEQALTDAQSVCSVFVDTATLHHP